jgi:hypothetical protein
MDEYVKMNVAKTTKKSPGSGLKVKEIITLIDIADILLMPQRDKKGVRIPGAIIPKANGYAISVYMTQSTAVLSSNSDGDPDNEGFTPSIKFNHPGNELEVREFKANWLGRSCIVIIDYCNGKKDLIGDTCNPCKMQVNYNADKDSTSNEFTFAQLSKGEDIALYENTVPYAAPKAVMAAGETTVDLVGEGQYQTTGHSAGVIINAVTGADHGMFFTVLGSGVGTPASIAASATFLLENGTTWVGAAGKQITFRAFKTGVDTFVYIEQSRY